jgi:hypothetical protein
MDFFISYTSADRAWAEWIGFALEDAGYSVILQAWDFRPGSNFVLEMQEAARKAKKTVMVLSPDYLKSQFASPEWAAAFATDPQGLKRALLPIIVRDCKPDGLLGQIVHVDLTGLDQEEALPTLLAGVRSERAKPSVRPSFPGLSRSEVKAFPGAAVAQAPIAAKAYMPKMRRAATDADKRRFLKASFDTIGSYFEGALVQLARSQPGLEHDFQRISAVEFTAEIFLHGKSVAACRIWQGGMLSDNGISYSEGRHSFGSNSCNEILSVTDDEGDVALSSLMGGFSFGRAAENINLKRMSTEQAAEYLWRRFVGGLER